jgi:hypothetical protein
LKCRNCGEVVDPRRVELGYDYCLKEECQQRCMQRVELAAVGVNKAADYIIRADEVLPPPPPPPSMGLPPPSTESVDPPASTTGRKPRPTVPPPKRAPSALERLREQEAKLAEALDRIYQEFRLGEITAREMDAERDRLVDAFNRRVMSENIRYRSFLRPAPHRGTAAVRS